MQFQKMQHKMAEYEGIFSLSISSSLAFPGKYKYFFIFTCLIIFFCIKNYTYRVYQKAFTAGKNSADAKSV